MRHEELHDAAATVYEGIGGGGGSSGPDTSGGAQRAVAEDLGISRATLVRWIGRSGIGNRVIPAGRTRSPPRPIQSGVIAL